MSVCASVWCAPQWRTAAAAARRSWRGSWPGCSSLISPPGGGGGFHSPMTRVASSKGVGRERWFLSKLCLLGALLLPSLKAGDLGSHWASGFFPHSTLCPQFTCWGVCAYMHACLLVAWFLYLFVILGRGWLGWPAGSEGGAQLLGVSNRACFRLGTAAAETITFLVEIQQPQNLGGCSRISTPPFPASRSELGDGADLPALERGGADLSDSMKVE